VGAFAEEVKKRVQTRTFEAGTSLKTNDGGNNGVIESHDVIENTRLTWITGKKLVYTYENARHSVGAASSKLAAICPNSGISLKTSLLSKIVPEMPECI
jgi:hypothetical protein